MDKHTIHMIKVDHKRAREAYRKARTDLALLMPELLAATAESDQAAAEHNRRIDAERKQREDANKKAWDDYTNNKRALPLFACVSDYRFLEYKPITHEMFESEQCRVKTLFKIADMAIDDYYVTRDQAMEIAEMEDGTFINGLRKKAGLPIY